MSETVKELKKRVKMEESEQVEMTHIAVGRHKDKTTGNWVIDVIEYNPEAKVGKVKTSHEGTPARENMIEMFKLEVVRNNLLDGEN